MGPITQKVRTRPMLPPTASDRKPRRASHSSPLSCEAGAPVSRSLHPDHHESSRAPAEDGKDTKSPTAGTPVTMKDREPNSTTATTRAHASHAMRALPTPRESSRLRPALVRKPPDSPMSSSPKRR